MWAFFQYLTLALREDQSVHAEIAGCARARTGHCQPFGKGSRGGILKLYQEPRPAISIAAEAKEEGNGGQLYDGGDSGIARTGQQLGPLGQGRSTRGAQFHYQRKACGGSEVSPERRSSIGGAAVGDTARAR